MNQTQTADWKRRIFLFLVSQSITLFGSTLVQMAVVWYATMRTSSGAWVAAFTVCAYLPQFLISLVGGVWADRHSRKKLIIGADGAIAAVTLVMALAIPRISAEPALLGGLLVMSVIRSLGAGVQTPAVGAAIPQLVPQDQLMNWNGVNAAMQSLVQFAAPAAAGLLLSVSSLPAILMVDILTAAFGIGLLSRVALPEPEVPAEKAPVFADLTTGLRYAFSDRLIGRLFVLYGLFTLLSVPAGFLAGLHVRRNFGNTYWYLTAVELAGFAGMAAGGLVMSGWGGFQNRMKTLRMSLTAFGAFAVGMAFSGSLLPYLLLMLLYGVAMTMVQTSVTTLLQERTEAAMQGRVFGLLGSLYAGFLPIGMAVFGPMADVVPLPWIMTASGGAALLMAAAMGHW